MTEAAANEAVATVAAAAGTPGGGMLAPLAIPKYRNIWLASLLSNFGQLIQGVGAAWEMTRMGATADMVALVQSAIMLPTMLFSLFSGAIADMFDRRKIALIGYGFSCLSACALTAFAHAGLVTPWLLLASCFLIGSGAALFGPAWQASVREQVPAEHLSSAVALGTISYNAARSIGPAIGGVIVATAGAASAFALNALCYIPSILAFLAWRRVKEPSRFSRERIDRAVLAGVRYALHSPPIRILTLRVFISGLAGSSVFALTPLVAKELLGGGATTYGVLLGMYGIGAVGGALLVGQARRRMSTETAVRLCAVSTGLMFALVGISRNSVVTALALVAAGIPWMLMMALLSVGAQLAAPRWVTGRVLAFFGTAMSGGFALGAWMWGNVARDWGTDTALVASGIALPLTLLLGLWWPVPAIAVPEAEMETFIPDPDIQVPLTPRSGPIVVEIDYRIPAEQARTFYDQMQEVGRIRSRNGAFGWSLAREISDPERWTERYHCPTWDDFLRQRNRGTQSDQETIARANHFHRGPAEGRVRRWLERPVQSLQPTGAPGATEEPFPLVPAA